MKILKIIILLSIGTILLTSCAVTQRTKGQQFAKLYEEKPVSLLILPPINKTNNVDAKEALYTSINKPLIDAGYYVISPLLALDILKAESAYDAELFLERPLTAFRQFFGADAVIFPVIHTWKKKGFGIQTKLTYIIKSTITGETLFERECDLYLDLSSDSGSSSLISQLTDVAISVINTVSTEHITAARKANLYIFSDIPKGKYSPNYLLDKEEAAKPKSIKKTVKAN